MKRNKADMKNYLDYIPYHNTEFKSEIDDEGNVTIFRENKGVFCFITQRLLKKPRISQIHLDEMGNFIWPLMDGDRNILQISESVKERFGDRAEPLYNRLVSYISTLAGYGFIKLKEPDCKGTGL